MYRGTTFKLLLLVCALLQCTASSLEAANFQRLKRAVKQEAVPAAPVIVKQHTDTNFRFESSGPAPAAAAPAKDETTNPQAATSTSAKDAVANNNDGSVTVGHNGQGNNIAIRNTNTVVLSGGYPSQSSMVPGAPPAVIPQGTVGAALPGKQDNKELADEQKMKADAASKANEEQQKKTQLQLDPKWTVYGGDYQEPDVYMFKSTICFVRGLIRGSEGLVGTLPANCRPKARLVFSMMKTNKPARVDVLPDGRIYTVTAGGGDGWLSLSGISFSIDTNPEITLVGGWSNFGGDYRGNSLTKEAGVCMLSGMIKGTSWGTMGKVDGDCLPDAPLIFSSNNHDGITRMDLQKNAYFNYAGGSANNGWVCLDGMVWTKGGGMPLTLLNNWVNYGSWRGAKYERIGDLCILSGLIKNTGEWSSLISTLPAECRPKKRLVFGGNVHTNSARVDVLPDGGVVYVTGKMNWEWLSLSNIHFVVA